MPRSTISATELEAWLEDGDEVALFDVREHGQFGMGHPFLAAPLPFSLLETRIDTLVPRRQARIVLVDGGDGVARMAAEKLARLGYPSVHVLDGGVAAWEKAGHKLFKGVFVPSKAFGEFVEHAYETPVMTAQELEEMRAAGRNLVLFDSRTFEEYHKQTIPGAISCPGAELPYRVPALVDDPETLVVVSCGGRTRSIVGAQALINAGLPNPVASLRNGTQGWRLAGFSLEHGADRQAPAPSGPALEAVRKAARQRFVEGHGVPVIDGGTLLAWRKEADRRTLYVIDVRGADEYARDHVDGAIHVPGGQLVQATDQWLGVRRARVVLVDDDGIRAPVTAHWLRQMGWEAVVLDPARQDGLPRGQGPWTPRTLELRDFRDREIGADALDAALQEGAATVVDVGASMAFRKAHVPGALWVPRPRLAAHAARLPQGSSLVLTSEDGLLARLALDDLKDAGLEVRVLVGGLEAWRRAGKAVEETPDTPPDDACIDYLFWLHDRHEGVEESMRGYLAWELSLVDQVAEEGALGLYRKTAP